MSPAFALLRAVAGFALLFLALHCRPSALADADDVASPNSTSLGLQPIRGPIPHGDAGAAASRASFATTGRRVSGGARRQRPHEDLPHRRARRAVDARAGPDRDGEHLQRRRAGAGDRRQARRHRRHRLHERRRDARLDPHARHSRHPGRDGRRRRHLAAARPARAATSSTASSPISRARSSITRTTTRRCSTPDSTARSSSSRRIRDPSNAAWRTISSR